MSDPLTAIALRCCEVFEEDQLKALGLRDADGQRSLRTMDETHRRRMITAMRAALEALTPEDIDTLRRRALMSDPLNAITPRCEVFEEDQLKARGLRGAGGQRLLDTLDETHRRRLIAALRVALTKLRARS